MNQSKNLSLLERLPQELRQRLATEAPTDQLEDIAYEILVRLNGGMTKEQLLGINLAEFDRLATYPTGEGTDWQLMRNKILFLQTAVQTGIPFRQVLERTIPIFGRSLKPPFTPIVEVLEPSHYQPPPYDQSRHTPDIWSQEANAGWDAHRNELLRTIKCESEHLLASGQLKEFNRPRITRKPVTKETIIPEEVAYKMAVAHFFHQSTWVELAREYPPESGYTGSPPDKAKQKRNRANQIRMRITPLLVHRYFAAVRLLRCVHARLVALRLRGPPC